MRQLLTILFLSASLTCAAADKDDPGGWTKAKWGMTEDQILQAFDGAAARLTPPEKVSSVQVNIGVDPVDLASAKFHALMVPDKDGKLKSVILEPRKGETQNAYLYERLQELLVQKYGRPWKSEAEHSTDLQWTFPTTIITLTFTSIPAMDFYLITLQYAYKPEAPI